MWAPLRFSLICLALVVPLVAVADDTDGPGFGERHTPPTLQLVTIEISMPEIGDVPTRFWQALGPDTPRFEPFYVAGWQELSAEQNSVTLPVGQYLFGAQTRPERARSRRQWEYTTELATIEHSARYELRHVSRGRMRTALIAGGSAISVIGASLVTYSLVRLHRGDSIRPILGLAAGIALAPGGAVMSLSGAFLSKERLELVRVDVPPPTYRR